jgi:DNA-directed RNA polymerase subunit RPC12/RpoP
MPDLSQVKIKIRCPTCGSVTPAPAGVIRFQWGEIPYNYRDGDEIRWLTDREGQIVPPFALVRAIHEFRWNYGEPRYRNVLAFDIDPHKPEFRCANCGAVFEGVAARVVDGRFDGAVGFLQGSIAQQFGAGIDSFEVAVREPDGQWKARTDWFNQVLVEAGDQG